MNDGMPLGLKVLADKIMKDHRETFDLLGEAVTAPARAAEEEAREIARKCVLIVDKAHPRGLREHGTSCNACDFDIAAVIAPILAERDAARERAEKWRKTAMETAEIGVKIEQQRDAAEAALRHAMHKNHAHLVACSGCAAGDAVLASAAKRDGKGEERRHLVPTGAPR